MPDTHDNISHTSDVQIGSERTFGIVFAVVFALIALWPLKNGADAQYWAAILALLFLLSGFFAPRLLKPLNLIWFKFGLLLHKIVNPIVMGMLFLTTVTPIGLIMRVSGKDLLRLKLEDNTKSYWIRRDPDEINPESMRNQF
jgi:predicted membrane metal-binding protein|tara:strand:- start:1134 stop:1559 length:426 start_codon:yes stop_codon:yes gene_type:complete